MRIKKLELKNFRGFENLIIEFPESESGLAVFIGVNGAGKSSVLDAINLCFDTVLYRLYRRRNKKELKIKTSDVTIGHKEVICKFSFLLKNTLFTGEKYKGRKEFGFDSEGSIVTPPLESLGDSPLSSWVNEFKTIEELEFLRNKLVNDNPFLKFFPTERFVSKNPSLKSLDINKITIQNELSSPFQENVNFNNFFEWFRSMEDYENEQKLYVDPQFSHKILDAVREAIHSFIPNFSKLRVRRQPSEDLVLEKNGKLLSISNLSHGEKLGISMFGEIARMLALSRPHSDFTLQGEGIVLIDEIELHLHPGWQRDIVPKLRKTFPNIQFILTTHSPQVLSKVPRENVFILEDFKLVENTPHTEGKDTNSILYEVFGVESRPAEATKEFRKLSRLIDDPNKLEEAKQMLKNMEKKYGIDDKEIVSAKMQLEFLND